MIQEIYTLVNKYDFRNKDALMIDLKRLNSDEGYFLSKDIIEPRMTIYMVDKKLYVEFTFAYGKLIENSIEKLSVILEKSQAFRIPMIKHRYSIEVRMENRLAMCVVAEKMGGELIDSEAIQNVINEIFVVMTLY